ncbi:MAG: hypothetical protein P8185_24960 [Deltaproteobacteria bacterium]
MAGHIFESIPTQLFNQPIDIRFAVKSYGLLARRHYIKKLGFAKNCQADSIYYLYLRAGIGFVNTRYALSSEQQGLHIVPGQLVIQIFGFLQTLDAVYFSGH